MPALANYCGTGELHNAGGSICKTQLNLGKLLYTGDNAGVYYYPPNKRARISSSVLSVESETEVSEQQSIEILPDECLFEILRRLPRVKERCLSLCVSKRWLNVLTSMRLSEFSACNDVDMVLSEDDDDGSRVRCLEGKKATDMTLFGLAVGRNLCNGLVKLSITGSSMASNFGVSAVARSCTSLRALSLWNVPHVGDKGLPEVAKECHLLEKLDLSHCPSVTSKGLISVAQNCPNLTTLKLESCPRIGNEALLAIGRYCPKLESITVKDCPLVGDHGISSLISSASPVLSKVNLHGLSITDFSLAVIGHYGKSITSLMLSNLLNVTERGFWVMGNARGLHKLVSLGVTSCRGVTDLSLEALGKCCITLKQVCLRKCGFISDNGLVAFSKAMGSLETLKLEECNGIGQSGICGVLSSCGGKLKFLSLLRCTGIRDLAFKSSDLYPCNSLRSLSVQSCPGFGNGGLANLGKLCPNLQHLDLSGLYGTTDAGLLPLIENNRAGLVTVNLTSCFNLTDGVVYSLAKLQGGTLEVLNLNGCRRITDSSLSAMAENCMFLRDLDVSKCGITDSGIASLSRAEKRLNLQVLSVSGCSEVSNKSLVSLKKLGRTLLGLNIRGCDSITNETVQRLVESLWRCDILS
ncbi:PREDICTED: EIN3-binding F-box protein 1-like [Tarenaya hassleriana]|uniref:EIN3-binding F-box protein 1-like n=1 Tax=Tarenaya hassleriana TaxID=28532 RepID=UPI00053C5177|nr:PREDICTED: EIN3-binding F-box protein 1-like [Tarenaya hassleriana]